VDTTCIHPTCQSRIQAEWKDTQNRITSYELYRKEGKQNLATKTVGHAVKSQTRFKHQTYSPLVTIAQKQKIDGKRTQSPIFIAAVANNLAELGHETVELQEWLTSVYARKLSDEGPCADGITINTLNGEYRQYSETISLSLSQKDMLR